jgi:hypothetical protein
MLCCWKLVKVVSNFLLWAALMKAATEFEGKKSFDSSFFPDEYVSQVTSSNEKYIVFRLERLGLMNRIRSMVDWYLVAKLLGRKLIVNWKPSFDCNVEFNDLFEAAPKDVLILKHDIPVTSNSSSFIERAAHRYNLSMKIIDTDSNNLLGKRNVTFFVSKEKFFSAWENISLLVTDHDARFVLEDVPCSYYLHQHSLILSQFKPHSSIVSIVNDVMKLFTTSIPVGVHIRMHDSRYDWEIIPSLKSQYAQSFGYGATLEDFVRVMKEIENHFRFSGTTAGVSDDTNNRTNQTTLIRFFIASNDFLIKREILKVFPTAISLSSEISRESLAGIQHALAEWLIISQCALILNTYGSSFALEASFYGKKPLASLWENRLVFMENSVLHYCGMLQFATYYSLNAQPITLIEGESVNYRKVGTIINVKFIFI